MVAFRGRFRLPYTVPLSGAFTVALRRWRCRPVPGFALARWSSGYSIRIRYLSIFINLWNSFTDQGLQRLTLADPLPEPHAAYHGSPGTHVQRVAMSFIGCASKKPSAHARLFKKKPDPMKLNMWRHDTLLA